MEFGVFLNPQAPADHDSNDLVNGLLRMTRTAEQAGFDLISSGQHYLSDYTQIQMMPLLARAAAEAGSMTVATGATILPLQPPVHIAEEIASLNAIADQAIAGVGAGYRDTEFDAFGVDKSTRGQRLEEGIELLNRLWTEESVTFNGEYYAVEDATLPACPDEKPPVWLAANANVAVRRAAHLSDAWYVNPHATISEIHDQKQTHYDPIRREKNADTSIPIMRETFVAPIEEEAYETARTYLESKYRRYVEWGQHEAMEDNSELTQSFDALAEDRFILGTPADVCAELERYEAKLDADHIVFRLQWPGLPFDRACDCIELLGDEVLPYI